ncbi:hypothetical protein PC116_g21344 [Phytophthora cactorum]|nr:hypothetical protein PC116_g21344 [Phytophthora cactorum]
MEQQELNAGRSLGGTAIGPDAARRFSAGLAFLQALGIRSPRRSEGLGSLAMPGTSASPAAPSVAFGLPLGLR